MIHHASPCSRHVFLERIRSLFVDNTVYGLSRDTIRARPTQNNTEVLVLSCNMTGGAVFPRVKVHLVAALTGGCLRRPRSRQTIWNMQNGLFCRMTRPRSLGNALWKDSRMLHSTHVDSICRQDCIACDIHNRGQTLKWMVYIDYALPCCEYSC